MAFDPNRWTQKTQEAVSTAVEVAKAESNPEVTPDHLLAALLRQEEGIVLPILQRVGLAPLAVRNAADDAIGQAARRPTGARPACRASSSRSSTPPTRSGPSCTTSTCPPSTSSSRWSIASGIEREQLLAAMQEVRGQPPRHVAEPGGAVPGAREVRPRPHRGGPRRQDRPGHRARRGDPARHPGAVPPHQEQPGADRRARAWARRPSSRAWPGGSSRATCPRA